MAILKDLRPSITELSYDDQLQLILMIRRSRKIAKIELKEPRKKKAAKKKTAKKKSTRKTKKKLTAEEVLAKAANMTPKQLQQLIAAMEKVNK
jgi:hypothetical protein